MTKILFINPSKWGRGITPIWIPSHYSSLKKNHEIKLFDCTFYSNWTDNEIKFNTENKQYKKSDYENYINYNENDIFKDLQVCINEFKPDIIFWSALSSHIHGEGEYVNIQYGSDLLSKVDTDAIKITGGIQATSNPEKILNEYKNIDFLIRGESELILKEICNLFPNIEAIKEQYGLAYRNNKNEIILTKKQKIISNLDLIPEYDYSLFDDQIFFRPYNGEVIRAVDYEMSRGCVFTCSYCVETIIQNYYSVAENKRGVLQKPKQYLRNKSANRIFSELSNLNKKFNVKLIRCQDTNFLTINKSVLKELSDILNNSELDIKLYIETRPEGINEFSIELLKKLKVDGVGMGLEVSTEGFREESLNRYASQEKIIRAFDLLKSAGIKRTAYNIIGLPNQDEKMIIDTIKFNAKISPDNITVAYYSPYYGTSEQKKSNIVGDFSDYEHNVDGQIRSVTKSDKISLDKLNYYKSNFVNLVNSEK